MPVPGAEDATNPFWSPDGRAIGYFTITELKTIDLTGGPPQTVTEVPIGIGGTWNNNDVIVFGSLGGELSKVSAAGGVTRPPAISCSTGAARSWHSRSIWSDWR